MAGLRFTQPDSETQPDTAAIPKAAYSPDFFEDELRGYRLLKAAKLTSSEKQNILTQTSNSTSFLQVRRALRTLFAEEDESGHSWGRRPRIWWTDDQQSWDTVDDAWQCWDAYDPGHATWYAEEDEESYWAEWTGDDWDEAEWPDLDEAAEDGKGKSVQFHSITIDPSIYLNTTTGTRVIVDTGASENAVGASALATLLEQSQLPHEVSLTDRPVFKFGNGQQAQATSRVDLSGTSIGRVSFYVLGGEASATPPLLGGKTLRQLGAVLAYENNMFIYHSQDPQPSWFA
ncbi:unnamed protein product, partial [Durusdinium trenchii]